MITLITGTPGAGKTLYTISKLLLPLVGTTVKQEVDGVMVEYPRTIYTNIKGLLIDHELIDGSDKGGLRNWHEWAKPGSVIVFDEVQKVWEPRANGSKVPPDIQALETHRHMGVDFILITQGLMLTERNLCMLGNRHLHVRRFGNMRAAIVYEWDHASRSLLFAKAFTKSPWRYNKKVFKLYRSADLHTKQPRKLPGLVWFLLAGLVAMAVLAPTFYGRMQERIGGPVAAKSSTEAKKPGQGPSSGLDAPLAVAAVPVKADEKEKPVFAGCALMGRRCTCFDAAGMSVDKGPGFCTIHTGAERHQALNDLKRLVIADQERHTLQLAAAEQDNSLLMWVGDQRERAGAGKLAPHATARALSPADSLVAGSAPVGRAN
jgi:zona occludens toxin